MNALITGATKGIGRAIAFALAEKGYNLGICARNESELTALSTLLQEQYGIQVAAMPVDCSKKEALLAFYAFAVKRLGSIDVLVNNAGLFMPGTIMDEPDTHFEEMMQLNVFAPYYLTKIVAADMLPGSHVFTICSLASVQNLPHAPSYSISKMAVLALHRVLKEELRQRSIKATAILPGATLTDSWKGTVIDTKRFVQAEDIAATVVCALQMSAAAYVDEISVNPLERDFS